MSSEPNPPNPLERWLDQVRVRLDGRPVLAHVISWAVLVFLSSVLMHVDLLGVASASDRLTRGAVNRIVAPWVPVKGRNRVTVIELDDAYLQREGRGWPASYADHARVLEQLLIPTFRPNAVFLDFLFVVRQRDDGSLGHMVSAIEKLRDNGVRVYVAAPNPSLSPGRAAGLAPDPNWGLIREIAAVACPVIVEWRGMDDGYPLWLAEGLQSVPKSCGTRGNESPAIALLHGDDSARRANSPAPEESLWLLWGTRISPTQAAIHETLNCEEMDAFSSKLAWSWRVLKRDIVRSLSLGDHQPYRAQCQYNDVLTFSQLFPKTDDLMQPSLGQRNVLLEGRMVLIGDGLRYSLDQVASPIHGLVPGVTAHAMALDNLLSFGTEAYVQAGSHGGIVLSLLLNVVGIAIFVFARYFVFYSPPGGMAFRRTEGHNRFVVRFVRFRIWLPFVCIAIGGLAAGCGFPQGVVLSAALLTVSVIWNLGINGWNERFPYLGSWLQYMAIFVGSVVPLLVMVIAISEGRRESPANWLWLAGLFFVVLPPTIVSPDWWQILMVHNEKEDGAHGVDPN